MKNARIRIICVVKTVKETKVRLRKKITKSLSFNVSLLAVFLYPIPALTMPVSYDELVDGDIIGDTGLLTTFNFDVGVNVISGSRTGNKIAGITSSDGDDFFFNLDTNLILTNITFAYNNVVVSGVEKFGDTRFLSSNTEQIWMFDTSGPTDPSPKSLFASLLPIGAGTYLFSDGAILLPTTVDGDWDATWDYTLSFTVASVPVPPAVWLFGSGLIGLIGIARRKKA